MGFPFVRRGWGISHFCGLLSTTGPAVQWKEIPPKRQHFWKHNMLMSSRSAVGRHISDVKRGHLWLLGKTHWYKAVFTMEFCPPKNRTSTQHQWHVYSTSFHPLASSSIRSGNPTTEPGIRSVLLLNVKRKKKWAQGNQTISLLIPIIKCGLFIIFGLPH